MMRDRVLARRTTSQHGAATAELGILLPLLLLTALGLVDFARGAYEAISLDSAVNAGGVYAMRSPSAALDTTGIRNAVLADISDLDTKQVTVESRRTCECSDGTTIDCSLKCSGKSPLMFVSVQAAKTFKPMFSYPGIPDSIPLTRQMQVRVR